MDQLIAWLPAQHPAGRRDHDRARRLPPRQPDLPSDRAARARGARLGAVDAGPSARGFLLPLHELAHPAGAVPRHRRASTSRRSAFRRSRVHRGLLPAHRPRRRSTGTTGTSTRLQHVPARGDPAGHHEARAGRHRLEPSTRSQAGAHRPLAERLEYGVEDGCEERLIARR